jgi:hypothetical protein
VSDPATADLDSLVDETETVEFKAEFDVTSKQDWCELIKDIVAIANTGGGLILFGVRNNGSVVGGNVDLILAIDPADLANKIHSYTEQQFSGFALAEGTKASSKVAVLRIQGTRIPIVFTSPGTYAVPGGAQKSAFSKGTVYFRHSAKSEPGTTEDLRKCIERELASVKEFWLQGISKVVTAPPGTVVQVVRQEVSLTGSPGSTAIRLTNAEGAPEFRAVQADKLYPYRQKELINKVNEHFGKKLITQFDIWCIRYAHRTDDNPTYSYKSQWSPRQYSDACFDWMIAEYGKDNDFFKKAREIMIRKYKGDS